MALTKSGGKNVSIMLVVLMAWLGVSSATLYKIEWTDNGVVDYMTWAASQKFHVGDVIVFKYKAGEDSVVRVTHKNFRSCNTVDPISVVDSGEDSITIRSTHAHLYFVSGVPGRCEAGQKVDIRVSQPSSSHLTPPPSVIASQPSLAPAPGPDSSVAAAAHPKALVSILVAAIGVLLY